MTTLISEYMTYDGSTHRRMATFYEFDSLEEAQDAVNRFPYINPEELEVDLNLRVPDYLPSYPDLTLGTIDSKDRYRYFYIYDRKIQWQKK